MLLQGTAPLGLAPEAPCAVKKAGKSFSGKICPQSLLQWFCRWGLISLLSRWFIINAEGAWSHLSALLSVWFTALWGEMERLSPASSPHRWVNGGGEIHRIKPERAFPLLLPLLLSRPPPRTRPSFWGAQQKWVTKKRLCPQPPRPSAVKRKEQSLDQYPGNGDRTCLGGMPIETLPYTRGQHSPKMLHISTLPRLWPSSPFLSPLTFSACLPGPQWCSVISGPKRKRVFPACSKFLLLVWSAHAQPAGNSQRGIWTCKEDLCHPTDRRHFRWLLYTGLWDLWANYCISLSFFPHL